VRQRQVYGKVVLLSDSRSTVGVSARQGEDATTASGRRRWNRTGGLASAEMWKGTGGGFND
jgi:hypothetical protein